MATVTSAMNESALLSQRVIDLQARLSSTSSEIGDYRVVKCMEASLMGKEMPYDLEELITARQKVRDEINEVQDRVMVAAANEAAKNGAPNDGAL